MGLDKLWPSDSDHAQGIGEGCGLGFSSEGGGGVKCNPRYQDRDFPTLNRFPLALLCHPPPVNLVT